MNHPRPPYTTEPIEGFYDRQWRPMLRIIGSWAMWGWPILLTLAFVAFLLGVATTVQVMANVIDGVAAHAVQTQQE